MEVLLKWIGVLGGLLSTAWLYIYWYFVVLVLTLVKWPQMNGLQRADSFLCCFELCSTESKDFGPLYFGTGTPCSIIAGQLCALLKEKTQHFLGNFFEIFDLSVTYNSSVLVHFPKMWYMWHSAWIRFALQKMNAADKYGVIIIKYNYYMFISYLKIICCMFFVFWMLWKGGGWHVNIWGGGCQASLLKLRGLNAN